MPNASHVPGSGRLVAEHHDRPNLYRPRLRAGNSCGDLEGIVEIRRLEQVVPAELLLRLGEWPVGRRDLSVADTHGRGRVRRLQRIPAEHVSALLDLLREGEILL